MKKEIKPLWRADVVIPNASEGIASEVFSILFGSNLTSYSDLETGRTTLSVYLPDRQAWKDGLPLLKKAWTDSVGLPFPRSSISRVRREDWAESWKRHFKPMCIARRLWVRPSWKAVPLKAGQLEIVLDPGLSFGTGQHPTTSFCLQETIRWRIPDKRQSYLDIGTGSGILAIAAAKFGYSPIHAFDLDPESIRVARQNARGNGVGRRIAFSEKDVADLDSEPRRYSVVCANLISDVIIDNADTMLSRVEPGGTFIAAGILALEFHQVQKTLARKGWALARTRIQKEWQSGSFQRL